MWDSLELVNSYLNSLSGLIVIFGDEETLQKYFYDYSSYWGIKEDGRIKDGRVRFECDEKAVEDHLFIINTQLMKKTRSFASNTTNSMVQTKTEICLLQPKILSGKCEHGMCMVRSIHSS